jgi:hypothetical protein
MKWLPLVMILALCCGAPSAAAQSMDQDITVTGSDETLMPVPDPWRPGEPQIPEPATALPPAPESPIDLPELAVGQPRDDATGTAGQAAPPPSSAPKGPTAPPVQAGQAP